MRRAARCAGISLIEVMIAMVLMALVGVMSERALSQMLRARDNVASQQQRWRDIAFAFGRIGDDVAGAADGVPREAALTEWRGGGARLRWTRWGQDGLLLPLSYALQAGRLERTGGGDGGAEPVALLEGVAALEIRLLDAGGNWHAAWPAEGVDEDRPRAVALALTLAEGTRLQRIFALP